MSTNIITIDPKKNIHLVYASNQMDKIVELTRSSSDLNTIILILGESGTGKELIAQLIHSQGTSKAG